VNGIRVDIPSYLVKPGDEIQVCEKSRSNAYYKKLKEDNVFSTLPKWLKRDTENLKGTVIAMPQRDDIDFEVAEHLIVELYSK
jgi:small subunit ribosomal protein S4